MGDTVALSWNGYNEWAQNDVTHYAIYMSDRPFTDVSQMTPYAIVPAETFSITLTNLAAWRDHYFAVVAVDALGGFAPNAHYAASYPLAREVVSRAMSVFIGDEPVPPLKEVVSRELSVLAPTADVPAPVTGLARGFTARDSVNSFRAIDLDWTAYNEVAQNDVTRYRIYAGPSYYDDVSGMEPYAFAPAETKHYTLTGLNPYGIYYGAVGAEDARGQGNTTVRSVSAQATSDRVREVRNLAVSCGENSLLFTWQPPQGADPAVNNLLSSYRVYFAGSTTPLAVDRMAASYQAENLTPGHGYPFVITSVDNQGRESDGASLLAATLVRNP